MSILPVIEAADIDTMKGGSSLFQSGFWASFKSFFGWRPYYFLINGKNLIALVRSFKGIFSICYIPYAPDFDEREYISFTAEKIKKYLPKNCLFIRFDLAWELEDSPSGDKAADKKRKIGESTDFLEELEKSIVDIQPPSTVILDLTAEEDEILKGMKSKTRYNIRLSARKGVTIKKYGKEALDEWYSIYKVTAERDKIALHRFEYYQKLFSLADKDSGCISDRPDLRIYMAEVDGENIAGIITSFYNGKATYLYGASLNKKRETMPAYSLQWQAIRDAKEEGCLSYDFFGIPPADDPSHPMHGLYRFKTGFGGRIVHKQGCYDYKLNRAGYTCYRKAEQLRNYYYKKIKKR